MPAAVFRTPIEVRTYFELRTGGIIITPSKSRERTRLQQETSEGERGGERESAGTGILFEEPNPTGLH